MDELDRKELSMMIDINKDIRNECDHLNREGVLELLVAAVDTIRKEKMNREGYKDDTAEKAIAAADKIPREAIRLKRLISKVAELAGYDIVELTIKNKKTGRKYR